MPKAPLLTLLEREQRRKSPKGKQNGRLELSLICTRAYVNKLQCYIK